MTMRWIGLLGVVAMGLGCALGSVDGDRTAREAPSLSILSADPEHGFVGIYREGDRVVRFEAVRTLVTHDDWTLFDSSGVPVSISSRFTDEAGNALYTSFGESAPDDWQGEKVPEVRFASPPTQESAERRLELFHVAARAGEALARVAISDPRMAPERNELVEVASQMGLEHRDEAVLDAPAAAGGGAGVVATGESGTLSPKDVGLGATYYREKFRIKTNFLHVCTIWKAQ